MTTLKFRRDTSTRWAVANPVLGDGEPAYELDTGRFKIGDGTSRWLDLKYFSARDMEAYEVFASLQSHINSLLPHSVYDDGPSLFLLYENAKV